MLVYAQLLDLQAKDTLLYLQTVDAEKVAKINKGIPPFHEPSLPEMLKESH